MAVIVTHTDSNSWFGDCRYFYRHPLAFFCFGGLLSFPATMLVIIAYIGDDDVSTAFPAIGIILCVLSFISIVAGVLVGVWNIRSLRMYNSKHSRLDLEKSNEDFPGTFTAKAPSPSSLSEKSSRRSSATSSRRSSKSSMSSKSTASSSSVSIISINDKSKLIHLKKQANRRKRGKIFPTTDRLPSLMEEDTFVKSLSRGNSQTTFAQEALPGNASQSKHGGVNIEELREHLSTIGLGGHSRDLHGSQGRRHTRSFSEVEFRREVVNHENIPPKATTHRENYNERVEREGKSFTPRPDRPVLVSDSYERTGISLPS